MKKPMTLSLPNPVEAVLQAVSDAIPAADREKIPQISQIFTLYVGRALSADDASTRLANLIGPSDYIKQLDAFVPPAPTPQRPALPRKAAHRWTADEDQRLALGVEQCGMGNWQAVAEFVGGNRTKAQCAQRWFRGIDPKIDKSNWSFEEEHKLIELVKQLGPGTWTKIAQLMETRSDVQCRFRWQFLVKKAQDAGRDVAPISPPAHVTRPDGNRFDIPAGELIR